ncbi:GtrA family protein [Corynebacterium poyangense]|uniref:GtrA family protein n=1 Tax=Corynebacterium poyangense TaxID=2684405 RepID=A0A7H0SN63_9CORY|nr:GtrA family protein [Corynebacterium poyangense]MBZ8177007.1 GtrA family protein [Corynebacterium poyangense]QNQ89988.1 GtrA family protein [Corynebacterium poyangense]
MSASAAVTRARARDNLQQFIKFGIVGGSGTLVNIATFVVAKKSFGSLVGIFAEDPFLNLFGSQFHIRWYHVFMTIAFLVANLWNYQLNRWWTFRSRYRPSWLKGFFAFLMTGIGAFLVSLVVATLLMNPESPLALSPRIFDNSTGLRTPSYWANIISIVVAMPVNFILNKLWAFRKPKVAVISSQDPQ